MNPARALPRITMLGVMAALAWSCTKDSPTIPADRNIFASGRASADKSSDKKVDVCHMTGSGGHIINVSINALGAHLGHGDYVAGLEADPQTTESGDGIHFKRITDAVNAARATRRAFHEQTAGICRITITAAAGLFTGRLDSNTDPVLEGFPIYIDVPDVTLQGGLRMQLDAFGRATPYAQDESAVTTLTPNRPLRRQPSEWLIIVADNTDGYRGNGVVIDGFAFRSGHAGIDAVDGGIAIFSLRVQNLTVSNNRFERLLTSATDLRDGSAQVTTNYVLQAANCTFCLFGPGTYQVSSNTLDDGANVGVFFSPAPVTAGPSFLQPYQPQPHEAVSGSVTNNDIQHYLRQVNGVGTAVRIITSANGRAGDPQFSSVVVQHNVVEYDTFGLIADAGFPDVASSANLSLTLGGNVFAHNCRRDLFVSFTRHTTALGIPAGAGFAYLVNSSYTIALGGDVSASNAWYDNPTGSPPYGNSLIVDGASISNTPPVPYNAAAPCNP